MDTINSRLSVIDGGWKEDQLASFVALAQRELACRDPQAIASLSGVDFDVVGQHFSVKVFGRQFLVSYPSFDVQELSATRGLGQPWVQCLLLHYFRAASGASLKNEWISFRELPSGTFYQQAFQGYSGNRLARSFGNDLAGLEAAARTLGGRKENLGDLSYSFVALPRVPVAIVYWLGDEDFPPSAKVLFDASAGSYLPTDALAVVGGRLCSLLLEAGGKRL